MTCIFLQDWRLVKVAGGLVCLGVSMSFMSIFDTARCLERLSMPGPGLGQLNPWVKRVFFANHTMAPIKSCCGNAKQLQHFHASKDMTCLGPDTGDLTEISQTVSNSPGFWCHAICLHDRRRLEDQLVLKGIRMFCTVRSAYVFFFPHHITVCLNLSWRGRVRCWNIAQLDGLHQIVSDRKVGLWSSGFSPGNSTGFHPIPTSQSNLAAFESQVVQYRSGALFTHNTSSLTNSLA